MPPVPQQTPPTAPAATRNGKRNNAIDEALDDLLDQDEDRPVAPGLAAAAVPHRVPRQPVHLHRSPRPGARRRAPPLTA